MHRKFQTYEAITSKGKQSIFLIIQLMSLSLLKIWPEGSYDTILTVAVSHFSLFGDWFSVHQPNQVITDQVRKWLQNFDEAIVSTSQHFFSLAARITVAAGHSLSFLAMRR